MIVCIPQMSKANTFGFGGVSVDSTQTSLVLEVNIALYNHPHDRGEMRHLCNGAPWGWILIGT